MATLLRLTYRAVMFMALCIILGVTGSCTDEDVNRYAKTDVWSFGVSISNEWDTSAGTRASETQKWHSARFDNSELWLIASSEQNMDTTVFSTPKTRAAAVTTGNFYDSFGVYGYAYNGENWDNRSNVKPYFEAEKVSKNTNGLWQTAPLRYWPDDSYRMHFFAYAPFDMANLTVNAGTNVPELSYTVPNSVTDQKDLVVATADVDGNSKESVPLKFTHILTAVKVKTMFGMSGTVKKVALKNVKSRGSYSFGENSWTVSADEKDKTNFEIVRDVTLDPNVESGTSVVDGEYTFMMIPQTPGPDTELEVTIADNGTESVLRCSLAGKTDWKINNAVTYRVSKTKIIVEYEFSATGPSTFAGEGGTNSVKIESFKTENGFNKTPVSWENAGYYEKAENGSYTPLVGAAPNWVEFPAFQGDKTDYDVKVYSQEGEGSDKTGENSNITVKSPDKDLQNMANEVGSSSAPINLAGTDGNETTANCYIVNAPGYYKFPIVYGNALKNGAANTEAYNPVNVTDPTDPLLKTFVNHLDKAITDPWLKNNDGIAIGDAVLLWQDTPSGAPLIDESTVQVDGDYIKFHIPKGQTCVQGNAVIAVKDQAGNIAWSWHIWVTNNKPGDSFQFGGYRFFNSLLGYREAQLVTFHEREVYVKLAQKESGRELYVHVSQDRLLQFIAAGNAPYYQHGRKDPFPGASLKVTRTVITNGTKKTNKYSVRVLQDRIASFYQQTVSTSFTLGYAIKNPHTYIGQYVDNKEKKNSNTNWYWYKDLGMVIDDNNNTATGYQNLWGGDTDIKTVYDPCPAGYKIPLYDALDAVSNKDYADVEYVNTGIYFIHNKNTENEQRLFLQILCTRGYDPGYVGTINKTAKACAYTSRSNGSSSVHYLNFNGNEYWVAGGTSCMGSCILPQKEE